jgi:hypothetical protein
MDMGFLVCLYSLGSLYKATARTGWWYRLCRMKAGVVDISI